MDENPKPKSTRIRTIQTPKAPKRHEIDFNSKAPRAQGGKGLLSQSIPVQVLKNPWLKTLVLERRGREKGQGGEGRPGREAALFLRKGQREKGEQERERG